MSAALQRVLKAKLSSSLHSEGADPTQLQELDIHILLSFTAQQLRRQPQVIKHHLLLLAPWPQVLNSWESLLAILWLCYVDNKPTTHTAFTDKSNYRTCSSKTKLLLAFKLPRSTRGRMAVTGNLSWKNMVQEGKQYSGVFTLNPSKTH